MPLTNTSKPSSSVANATKINIGETWAAILTIWAAETRTWDATGSLIGNITKVSPSITNITRPA